MTKTNPMMVFHMPTDEQWLAAWARVNITHSYLERTLIMMIKTLQGCTVDEAVQEWERRSTSKVRNRVRALAATLFGDGPVFTGIEQLLGNAEHLSEKRNDLVHGLVAQFVDEGTPHLEREGERYDLPKIEQLEELRKAIADLTGHIHHVRLHGFVDEAMKKLGAKGAS